MIMRFFLLNPHIIYLKLYENRVVLRNVTLNKTIELFAIDKFSNARMVVANFYNAEKTVREALSQIQARKLISPLLQFVIQPMEKVEDGICEVERRAFYDLAVDSGAKYVYLVDHQNHLTDEQIKNIIEQKKNINDYS